MNRYSVKRQSFKSLIVFAVMLLPLMAYAEGDTNQTVISGNLFSIPPGDYSLYFLGLIFGTVGTILQGSGHMLGVVFRGFNNAVLALGGIVVLYTVIVSTINTAIDGEALGKKWSSMWVPFRVALGFAFLVPGASGYSLIQVAFMWIVIQGIGAADHVWATALNYFNSGGKVFDPTIPPSPQTYLVPISNAIKNVGCAAVLKNTLKQERPTLSMPIMVYDNTSHTVKFPGRITGTTSDDSSWADSWSPGVCGQISLSKIPSGAAGQATASYFSAAATQIVQGSQGLLEQVAKQGGDAEKSQITALSNAMLNAVQSYQSIMEPLSSQINVDTNTSSTNPIFNDMEQQGWIMAGAYYYNLYNLQASVSSVNDYVPKVAQTVKTVIMPPGSGSTWDTVDKKIKSIQSLVGLTTTATLATLKKVTSERDKTGQAVLAAQKGVPLGTETNMSGAAEAIVDIVAGGLSNVVLQWNYYFNSTAFPSLWHTATRPNVALEAMGLRETPVTTNPLNKIALFGNACVEGVQQAWVLGSMTLFALGFFSGLVPCISAALNLLVMWIVPLISVAMSMLLAVGLLMAYYIPMIPFMLFTFGGLGWMIGVVESMCAAPLVALGLAHPEGHDTWGKSEPAVMLIINLFMRPSLMIIGMLAGMTLCYVGVIFLNLGFSHAFNEMVAQTGVTLTGLFPPIGVMMLYTGLVMSVVEKSFSLVNVVPDKVLRWIEGGAAVASAFGEETQGMEQGVRSGYSSGAQAAGQGVSQSYSSSQELGEKGKKAAESSGGGEEGGGEASGGGGG